DARRGAAGLVRRADRGRAQRHRPGRTASVRRSVHVPRTSIKLAGVMLAAGLAAAACGTVKMGAAAILGEQRITSSTLSAQVSDLNTSYQANKTKVQLQFPASEMPQVVLGWMVRFQVRDRLAERENISGTP